MIDYTQLKKLSRDELESLVPAGFKFKTDPWDHQLASFLATISTDGMNEWLDLGTGKTKVAIDVVRYFEWLKCKPWKVLVICLSTAVDKWIEEIVMHSDCEHHALSGTIPVRWDHLQQHSGKPGFYVTNYEGIRLMMTKRVESISKKGKKPKKHEVFDLSKMKAMTEQGWDALVIDESHRVKNVRSITFGILSHLGKRVEQRMLLTGTPFGKTLLDIWSQYYIVDRGKTLGPVFSAWRKAHFVDKGWFGPDWKVTEKGEEHIRSVMFNRAIRYEESEIKGMPDKVYRKLHYKLSSKQDKAYDEALARIGPFKDIINRTMIFRQICSGIIVGKKYKFPENPKLAVLADLLDSVVDEYKVVVFHEFVMEALLIRDLLKAMKVGHVMLNGQVSETERWPGIKAFQDDPRVRVMVAHPLSGGASLDFNCAHYCVFFSNGYSPLNRRQCEKRIHRGRIKNRRFYYDLIGRNTIEVALHRSLMKDENMFNGIMNKKQLMNTLRSKR